MDLIPELDIDTIGRDSISCFGRNIEDHNAAHPLSWHHRVVFKNGALQFIERMLAFGLDGSEVGSCLRVGILLRRVSTTGIVRCC